MPSSRGIEYFFSKQQQRGSSGPEKPQEKNATAKSSSGPTDEELAKRLQAQFDKETRPQSPDGEKAIVEDGNGKEDLGPPPEPPAISTKSEPSPTINRLGETDVRASASPARTALVLSLQSTSAVEDTLSAGIPLDENPFTFEPAKYIPNLKAEWAAQGVDASYALLTRCFVLVNGTQSRIKIVDTLVNCIRVLIEGDPSSLLPMVIHPLKRSHLKFQC
jgi:DNA ligase 1